MESESSWVYGAAAVVAIAAAAMLVFAFLVTDAGVADDVHGAAPVDVAQAQP